MDFERTESTWDAVGIAARCAQARKRERMLKPCVKVCGCVIEKVRERERKRECGERLCRWLIGSSKAHLKNWVILQYNFSLNKNIKILISVRLSKHAVGLF